MNTNTRRRRCGWWLVLVAGLAGCQSGGAILRHGARLEPGSAARLWFIPPADGEILLRNRGPGSVDVRVTCESSDGPTQVAIDATGSYNAAATGLSEVHMSNTTPEHALVDYAVRLDSAGNTLVRLEYLDKEE